MRTKEEIYNEATLKSYAENPMGTREDVIHIAMEMYAKEYHEAEVLKLNKACVSGSFLSDLNFIIDNIGHDLVKDKVSKEAQTEYLKRLKMMRDELRQDCH